MRLRKVDERWLVLGLDVKLFGRHFTKLKRTTMRGSRVGPGTRTRGNQLHFNTAAQTNRRLLLERAPTQMGIVGKVHREVDG